eukprot:13162557-Ditylum_brightwellii.AAC.1
MLHWPEQVMTDLWPFAFDYTVFLHNHLPKRGHCLALIELFTQTTVPHSFFKGEHAWGCPVYILQPTLCEGKKIPQWAPQCTYGQFLGFSAAHSAQVALVCHLHTGSVTPQQHVVFDDTFFTVSTPSTAPPPHWEDLVHNCDVKYFTVEYNIKGKPLPLPLVPANWCLPNLMTPPAPSALPNPSIPISDSREKGTAAAILGVESSASTEGVNQEGNIAEETKAPEGAAQMEEAVPSEGVQHTEGAQSPSSPPSSTPPSLPQA